MITISANGNKPAYGIKEYVLDTRADIKNLPVKGATTGSRAFIIETSEYYMLNSKKEWVEIKPYCDSIFDGDDDMEVIYDGGEMAEKEPEDEVQEVIYDGGNA